MLVQGLPNAIGALLTKLRTSFERQDSPYWMKSARKALPAVCAKKSLQSPTWIARHSIGSSPLPSAPAVCRNIGVLRITCFSLERLEWRHRRLMAFLRPVGMSALESAPEATPDRVEISVGILQPLEG